ncbi:MAG: VOC family protein [Phyllobacteriaceae bacterium]|nr:VOC family protein [Phyllobacteriaceae bacterium]
MSEAPTNAVVWFEIPVRNLDKGKAFYGKVTGLPLKDEQMGPNMTAIFAYSGPHETAISGHIVEGEPAAKGAGATVHLAVDSLEPALARVGEAGGEVVSPIVAIPAGRFAYCRDPDGNSFGLFSA